MRGLVFSMLHNQIFTRNSSLGPCAGCSLIIEGIRSGTGVHSAVIRVDYPSPEKNVNVARRLRLVINSSENECWYSGGENEMVRRSNRRGYPMRSKMVFTAHY